MIMMIVMVVMVIIMVMIMVMMMSMIVMMMIGNDHSFMMVVTCFTKVTKHLSFEFFQE